ncbi:MAG: hypothetical protein AAFU85_10635 [Planctomycetota bacterium]
MIRILFATGVLAVVSIVEIGRTPEPTESVTSGSLTINYTQVVPADTASEAARILSDSGMFAEGDYEISMALEDGVAILEIPLVVAEVSPDARVAYALYARVLSDVPGNSQPVAIRLTHEGSVLETVSPVRVLGEQVFEHEQDFLYHTTTFDAEQLADVAAFLRKRGFTQGDHSIISLATQEDAYVIEVNLSQDPSDPEVYEAQSELFQSELLHFQAELFDGAAVRIIGCAANRDRYAAADWFLAGHRPGMSIVKHQSVSVAFDETIGKEIATRAAKGMVRQGVAHFKGARTMLTRQDGEYQFTLFIDPTSEAIAGLEKSCHYWGRRVFDQLPDAKSMRQVYVNKQNEQLLSNEIRDGLGVEMGFHQNWLYYDQRISDETANQVRESLEAWIFGAESQGLIRLQVEAEDQLVIQILMPTEAVESFTAEDIAEFESELKTIPLGQMGHTIEFIDHSFETFPGFRWETQ